MADGLDRRELLVRAGIGGAGLALAGGAAPAAMAHPLAKRGGTLRMARNEEPLSFDPLIPSDNGSIWVLFNMFDQLTTINRDSSGVVPSLAQSWEISKDQKTYTFHLRPGVRFSNGMPMTADDVVFSIKRSIVPAKVVAANPKGFAQKPVGTGPFALQEFKKGQFTHLVRNRQYWKKGRPYLDEVMIPYVTDDNTRILKLQAGEVDVAVNIPY